MLIVLEPSYLPSRYSLNVSSFHFLTMSITFVETKQLTIVPPPFINCQRTNEKLILPGEYVDLMLMYLQHLLYFLSVI